MFDLTDKRALVTGATGGIGAAIARALHSQGARVALSGSREAVLDRQAADLGERAHALPCDLSDSESVAGLLDRAAEALGGFGLRAPEEVLDASRHHQDVLAAVVVGGLEWLQEARLCGAGQVSCSRLACSCDRHRGARGRTG